MFNVLRYTEDLEKNGFSPEQAKTAVKIWVDLMNHNFVTKPDFDIAMKDIDARFNSQDSKIDKLETKMNTKIDALETKLNTKIDSLETKMDTGFKSLEQKLTIKLGGIMVLGISVIAVITKL